MRRVEISHNNVHLWKYALQEMFEWNANKNLVILAFNGDFHNYHFRLLHGLTWLTDNPTVDFNIKMYLNNEDFLKENNDVSIYDFNIFMATHLIHNDKQDFLIVKSDNLKNYGFKWDKQIVVTELHSNLLSNYLFSTNIDSMNLDFASEANLTQFKNYKSKSA